jgi:hypothetical protein
MIGSPEYRVTAGWSLYSVAQSRALIASLGRTQLLPAVQTNGKKIIIFYNGLFTGGSSSKNSAPPKKNRVEKKEQVKSCGI